MYACIRIFSPYYIYSYYQVVWYLWTWCNLVHICMFVVLSDVIYKLSNVINGFVGMCICTHLSQFRVSDCISLVNSVTWQQDHSVVTFYKWIRFSWLCPKDKFTSKLSSKHPLTNPYITSEQQRGFERHIRHSLLYSMLDLGDLADEWARHLFASCTYHKIPR